MHWSVREIMPQAQKAIETIQNKGMVAVVNRLSAVAAMSCRACRAAGRQADTGRQTDRETDRHRQTDSQTDGRTDGQQTNRNGLLHEIAY